MTLHRMKKAVTATVAAAALVVGASACGSDASDPAEQPSPSPSPVELDERPLEDQLREAIGASDLPRVQAVVAAGVDVNTDYGQGVTPLEVAVRRQDVEIADVLLDAGANPDALNGQAMTALHVAVEYNNGPLVTLLLEAGADPTLESGPPFFVPPLHLASRNDNTVAMAALLEFGASANHLNEEFGLPPLFYSAFWDAAGCAQLLVEYGADYNAVDEDGNTVLDFARLNRSEAVVAYLESIGAADVSAE